jgi:hypothetical protein
MHASTLTQSEGGQRTVLPGRLPGAWVQDEVTLRHLRTPSQVRTVLHLREEIDLSAHAAAASDFADLEKKETNAASSALLN